ncbi:hypothetical protein O3G_MSEX004537 [Manduca sexta]|uniref:ZAD domain-containing protein n=1 Tax=Manduca sexta TaxID=7130 RepID=A0A921YWT5_MANSE|nr:hypothetical protein O3G_MSEX004537 [Manduca sexta]
MLFNKFRQQRHIRRGKCVVCQNVTILTNKGTYCLTFEYIASLCLLTYLIIFIGFRQVFKNDRLPQKVCDKCSCKVNDFYQFCNETIEVQNRLRALFLPSDTTSVDLTLIKDNASPLPSIAPCEQSTQTDSDRVLSTMDIKQEPAPSPTLIKQEENIYESDRSLGNCSDNSDDMSLITLKKRKNTKKEVNGIDKKTKKKKPKLKDWEMLMKALPEGTAISLVDKTNVPDVKEECKEEDATEFVMPIDMKKVKSEGNQVDTYHCCVCLAQCYSRNEMRQHYRYGFILYDYTLIIYYDRQNSSL